ncbi:MAG: 4-hydroxythreonine-4-phosphate dehydrogenase PdxA [Enterobacterales bacterium]|nr:4-hydroxythreonine-4-phosphate dehydrogenase PdxA [Enterobacterales bacterium]
MTGPLPKILLTMGEPAGIGPELLAKIAQNNYDAEISVLASPALLQAVAKELSLDLSLTPVDWNAAPEGHVAGRLLIESVELSAPVLVGQLNAANSPSVLSMLYRAGELALTKQVDAIVTAPVHKAILNQINPNFLGHTEFFAEQANTDQVVMMLATDNLRIALATTHIPLSKVSETINSDLIEKVVQIIDSSLANLNIHQVKIAVCGINPHAGEEGLLGTEEKDFLNATIKQLANQGIQIEGPFPADSLFTRQNRERFDIFLAMYHDQGLPVVKAIGFGQCANITLGLPYIRTSVDHGTAIDIAPNRCASASSLDYAIRYAIQLAKGEIPQ